METTVNKRLNLFIESSSISKVKFSESIGRVRQDIDRWVNAGVKIPVPDLTNILKAYPNLSARWLLTGTGNMYEDAPVGLTGYRNDEKLNHVEDPEHIKKSNEDLRNFIKSQERIIEMQDEKIRQLTEEVKRLRDDKN